MGLLVWLLTFQMLISGIPLEESRCARSLPLIAHHQNLPILELISPVPALCLPSMPDKPSHSLTQLQETKGPDASPCSVV